MRTAQQLERRPMDSLSTSGQGADMYQVISIKDPLSPLAAFRSLALLRHWADLSGIELAPTPTGGYALSAPGLESGLVVSVPKGDSK